MNTLHTLIIGFALCMLIPFGISGQTKQPIRDSLLSTINQLEYEEKIRFFEFFLQVTQQDINSIIERNTPHLTESDKLLLLHYAQDLSIKKGKQLYTQTECLQASHNFGRVKAGELIEYQFYIKNIGHQPLFFHHANSSNHIKINFPKYPIPPKHTAIINVFLNTQSLYGTIKEGIILENNSEPNFRELLYIQGEVIPSDYNIGRNK